MSSSEKNLSTYSNVNLSASLGDKKIAIVVSEWNAEITEALYEGAYSTLIQKGARKENIIKKYVPGSFELSIGAQKMAALKEIDAIICLGCVIRGETSHFDFICQAVATGITDVSLKYDKPVIFGVLTTENKQQAFDRAGGKHGNKGDEAGITAVKMINF
ncbi:MAG TPA: 6,7-dimethyl-8-ribityllumazine synthase [Cytophagaceae bacterium]|jgi:6,7-dimethyl-8-ribityllumazine synthase|nr:6,7-dimethyl-8-ribityllumazine synthase [Cytophagaceae bacterium]